MKKVTLQLFIYVGLCLSACFAQSNGDFTPVVNGNWNDLATWGRYDASLNINPSPFVPAGAANVIIRNGFTVTLNSNVSCLSLNIQNGGVVRADNSGTTRTLTIGNASSVAYTNANITVNGTLGGAGTDANIGLLVQNNSSSAPVSNVVATTSTLSGTGTIRIFSINFVAQTANTIIRNTTLNINSSVELTGGGSGVVTLSCFNQTGSSTVTNENHTINVAAGVTVNASSTSGAFHLRAGNTNASGGNYTYNIFGTVDFSATTGVNNGFIPVANNTSSLVSMNIKNGGIFRTTTVFITRNLQSPAPTTLGNVSIIVENGGLFDASKIADAGWTNQSIWIQLQGSGALRRTVTGSSSMLFNIGNATTYLPVNILNSGTSAEFTVSLNDNYTATPIPFAGAALNNTYTISCNNAGAVVTSLRLGWQAAAEGSSFVRASSSVRNFTGGSWQLPANITQGANATVTVNGFSIFSNTITTPATAPIGTIPLNGTYTVMNDAALPLTLLQFTATKTNNNVLLSWNTTNEINTKQIEVQRSTNNTTFNTIGIVATNNTAGNHSYNFTDAQIVAGKVFYRLKMVDNDGSFSYSKVLMVSSEASVQVQVAPNPASNVVNIIHATNIKNGTAVLYDNMGKLLKTTIIQENSNITSFNIANLPKGNYVVRVVANNSNTTISFIKN